jgi:outer membrane receptor protein involved in Fe transport
MSIFRKLLLAGSVVAAGVSTVGVANAQQTEPTPTPTGTEAGASSEEIIVTGSRIRRSATNAPAPLIQVTQQDLLMSGEPNIIDYLADIPALSGSTVPEDTTGANLNDGGLSLLNLRDLGSVRTLVLVDGRRHVGAVQGGLQVDVDSIPTLLVESTEIITGGQSAVYGADAVSGVVNFILKKDFEGLDVDATYAQINQDGQYNGRISGLIGHNFLNDRLNVYMTGEYQKNEEVRDSDVDFRKEAWTLLNNDTDPNAATPDTQLDNILIRDARDIRFNIGGTVVLAGGARPSATTDPDIPVATCAAGSASFTTFNAQTNANCFVIAPELTRVFVFDAPGVSRPANFGTFQDQNGASRPVNVGGDGLNVGTAFSQGSRIPESEAYRFQGGLNFDITNNIQLFLEAKATHEETFDEGQPTFFQGGIGTVVANTPAGILGTSNFNVGVDNAYISTALRNAILANTRNTFAAPTAGAPGAITGTVADTRASFNIFGPIRTQFNERDVNRYVAGLRGDIDQLGFIKDVSWELGYTMGRTINKNNERGVDVVRFAYSADAIVVPVGTPGLTAGSIACRVRVLAANGIAIVDPLTGLNYAANSPVINNCVPQNIFGVDLRKDGYNPAAETYANATIQVKHTNKQEDFLAFASGNLWDFWGAGPIGVAAGYEYRKEETYGVGRSTGTAGRLLFLNTGPDFAPASYDTSEYFVEGRLPVFKDIFLGEYAEVSGAYRRGDYSNVKDPVEVFSLQALYRPVSDFTVRGTYGESVRVPNLAENFAPPTQTFGNGLIDPCDSLQIAGATAAIQANRIANCTAALGPNYNPTTTTITYTSGVPGRNAGNPNLVPEESRSFTWSAIFTPDFAPGLSLVIDYYDIKIRKAIASVTIQQALNNCYSNVGLNPGACSTFTRNGFIAPADASNFRVNDFIQGSINYAATTAKGVDFGASYALDLADMFEKNLGTVDFNLRGNYLIRQEDFTNIAIPSQASAFDGLVGLPRVRFLSTVNYSPNDKLQLSWQWDWQASQEIADERLLADDADNRLRKYLETGAYSQHDFVARYDVNGNLQIRGGVVNAFDAEPAEWLGSTTTADNFDLFGRRFFVGVRFKH